MASREYSKRLGTISDEQLQAALDRFGLGRLLSARPAQGGLFGQNILLETTEGAFVFRGAPHWNPAGEDDWQFPKERYFSKLVHEAPGGPPVPWPYLVESNREIFGWGYAIQPRLPGATLRQPMASNYSADEIAEQAAALGTALGGIHTVKLPACGHYEVAYDAIRQLETSYAEYVTATIERLLEASPSASTATTKEDVAWARSVIEKAHPAMELPFTPTVVHLDYGFHNVLFESAGGTWRVTGVVDWHTAEAGHPESDLARAVAADFQQQVGRRAEFLAGYRTLQPELEGFEQRSPAFMLWERLLVWEYWQRNDGFPKGLSLREWAEPYLGLFR